MDLEYATAVANRAHELMARHAVPPTSDNFAVWFQYVLRSDPALNRTIDIVISNKRTFDKQVNSGLVQAHKRAQGKDYTISKIVTDRLNDVLEKATSFLAKAAADNHAHVRRLSGVARQFEDGEDPMSIIGDLASELSRAALRATELEMKFVATSMELDQLRNSLKAAEQCANTDTLTGLASRRALNEFVSAAQIRSMEFGEPLCAMLIDIDCFKQLNDGYGHQLGDQVLRLIADVLKNSLRQSDLAARYGGDELIALLPNTALANCRNLAERVRKTIAERQVVRRVTGSPLAKVTVSVGVAQFRPGETVAELFGRCDRALYRAKEHGRNQTVSEDDLNE